jgi:hypothetical protein
MHKADRELHLKGFGVAEIYVFPHLEITLAVNQQIFWLQISVDEVKKVQVLEGQHNLRRVESRLRFTEAAHLAQVREHFTTGDVLEHHVQVGGVLEVEAKTHEEREADCLQDAFLIQSVLHLRTQIHQVEKH